MKTFWILPLLLFLGSFAFAGGNAAAALEKFKALEGSWTTTDKDGQIRTATFEVVADGSAVLETFQMSDDESKTMVTPLSLER